MLIVLDEILCGLFYLYVHLKFNAFNETLIKHQHLRTKAYNVYGINKPHHAKTNNLHLRKQRRRSHLYFQYTDSMIPLLSENFPASSQLLCLFSSVCVQPVQKLHYWFSHEAAQLFYHNHHFNQGGISTLIRLRICVITQLKYEKTQLITIW